LTEHGVAGRVVIVTGAGQGIGRGVALHLGRNGASVVVAEWKEHRAVRTVDELTALGVPALAAVCDISSKDQVETMVAAAIERFGRVDALVNNAQTFRPQAPMASVGEEDVDVFYDSGVKGTLWGMQAVYPHMQRAGWGRIVNFASAAVLKPQSQMASYVAAKSAVAGLTRALAREFRDRGVRVNAVAPGTMRTADNLAQMKDASVRWVELDDLVSAVLYLASDEAKAITGAILPVTGDVW